MESVDTNMLARKRSDGATNRLVPAPYRAPVYPWQNPEYRTKTELNMYNCGKSAKSPSNLQSIFKLVCGRIKVHLF